MTEDDLALLLGELVKFEDDPLGYVLWAYPWQEPGDLESFSGPEPWQREILVKLGTGVMTVMEAILEARKIGESIEALPQQFSVTSGHGIGKSALVSWILDWAQSTKVDTKGIVTANTENQLKTKTWAEFAKWHRMSMSKELFKMTATARFSIDPEHEKTWRIDMVPWSEKNTEAFAGMHNLNKRIIIVFDEASAIPDLIWETTEGALTDKNTQIIWCVFGNPTKNSGRFRDCFDSGRFAHRWDNIAVDSRTVSITNKTQIQQWIDDYGIDHDFVRVRVLGKFPNVDANSLISLEMAREATMRELPETNPHGVVLGVDCARFGDDASIIYPRRGKDARTLPPRVLYKLTVPQLANQVFRAYNELNAVAIFVDVGAMGAGVLDILVEMGAPAYGVDFGGGDDDQTGPKPEMKCLNKRAAIWTNLEFWLHDGCIPDDIRGYEGKFSVELSGPTYTYARESFLQLESKRDMKRRGLRSPDASDALACTLAYPSLADTIPYTPSSSNQSGAEYETSVLENSYA
jgi:hypothetical protein